MAKEPTEKELLGSIYFLSLNNHAMISSLGEMQLEMMSKVTGRKLKDLNEEMSQRMEENFQRITETLKDLSES